MGVCVGAIGFIWKCPSVYLFASSSCGLSDSHSRGRMAVMGKILPGFMHVH